VLIPIVHQNIDPPLRLGAAKCLGDQRFIGNARAKRKAPDTKSIYFGGGPFGIVGQAIDHRYVGAFPRERENDAASIAGYHTLLACEPCHAALRFDRGCGDQARLKSWKRRLLEV
jgi:hypothetical protein